MTDYRKFYKPTKLKLQNAYNKTVPDVIDHNLKILFCGINLGLYTAAVGHHFARPGNRFWKALFDSGITPRLYSPFEDNNLLELQLGITNLVQRATTSANEIAEDEFVEGGKDLLQKIIRFRPKVIAFVGIGAYQMAFKKPKIKIGKQEDRIGNSDVWVLPSTSGLNANYKPADLADLFQKLKEGVEQLK